MSVFYKRLFDAYNNSLRLPAPHAFNHTEYRITTFHGHIPLKRKIFLKRKYKKGWWVAGDACNQLMSKMFIIILSTKLLSTEIL
jgi:hypothetical protein